MLDGGNPLEFLSPQVLTALNQPRLPALHDARDAHIPERVQADLGAALTALRAAQQVVVREGRELTAASAGRNAALESQAAAFAMVAQLGVSLLRVAEQDALADRLRPSARRRGLTVTDELAPLPAEPVAPAPPAPPVEG